MKLKAFKVFVVGVVGLILSQTAVQASDENIYLGGSVSIQSYSHENLDNSYVMTVALFRLGADVSRWLGVESRFGVSAASDTQTESGRSVELSNTAMYGLYLKPRLQPVSFAGVYGLIGATYYDLYANSQSILKAHFERDTTRLSLGAGLELTFFKFLRVHGEGMLYGFKSGTEESLAGIEVGASILF